MTQNLADPIGAALQQRPQRRAQHSDHWRRRQAALGSVPSTAQPAKASSPGALDPAMHDMHEYAESGARAWSIWRHERAGWAWNVLATALGGISLPTAREMQLLFGARDGSAASTPCGSPCAATPTRKGSPVPGLDARSAGPAAAGPRGGAGSAPIVFLHGVGLGVMPYLAFIYKVLAVFGDTPIIVPEVRRRLLLHAPVPGATRSGPVCSVAHACAAKQAPFLPVALLRMHVRRSKHPFLPLLCCACMCGEASTRSSRCSVARACAAKQAPVLPVPCDAERGPGGGGGALLLRPLASQ